MGEYDDLLGGGGDGHHGCREYERDLVSRLAEERAKRVEAEADRAAMFSRMNIEIAMYQESLNVVDEAARARIEAEARAEKAEAKRDAAQASLARELAWEERAKKAEARVAELGRQVAGYFEIEAHAIDRWATEAHAVCMAIETLPASEQQTNASVLASNLLQKLRRVARDLAAKEKEPK